MESRLLTPIWTLHGFPLNPLRTGGGCWYYSSYFLAKQSESKKTFYTLRDHVPLELKSQMVSMPWSVPYPMPIVPCPLTFPSFKENLAGQRNISNQVSDTLGQWSCLSSTALGECLLLSVSVFLTMKLDIPCLLHKAFMRIKYNSHLQMFFAK